MNVCIKFRGGRFPWKLKYGYELWVMSYCSQAYLLWWVCKVRRIRIVPLCHFNFIYHTWWVMRERERESWWSEGCGIICTHFGHTCLFKILHFWLCFFLFFTLVYAFWHRDVNNILCDVSHLYPPLLPFPHHFFQNYLHFDFGVFIVNIRALTFFVPVKISLSN